MGSKCKRVTGQKEKGGLASQSRAAPGPPANDKNCQESDGLRLDAESQAQGKTATSDMVTAENKGLVTAEAITLGSTEWWVKCDRVLWSSA
jgi:hypothetical protein